MGRKIPGIQPTEIQKARAAFGEESTPASVLRFPVPAPVQAVRKGVDPSAKQMEFADWREIVPENGVWSLDIGEVTGHNLEARGREEVNHLLGEGWLLLHIYTLRYKEDEAWRERPMAILGKPRKQTASRAANGECAAIGGSNEDLAGSG